MPKALDNDREALSRRDFLAYVAAGSALGFTGVGKVHAAPPSLLASDEKYWSKIAKHYNATKGIVNLEHGYWGKMAKPVQQTYLAATKMVDQQNSFYARKDYNLEHQESVHRIAQALGVQDDEIALTRNATEAIHNLIRQYKGLGKGDAVLYCDLDYPSYKTTMNWLASSRGVEALELNLPGRANQQLLLAQYVEMFDLHPNIKLMLLTHVSNQHGLVLPVKEIASEARRRGIDVICDNAQSWGLLDYKLGELGVDWAGFNLHKWIGAPLGIGALYMKRGSLEKIAPYPGESDPKNETVHKRIHTATSNFAAFLSVPAALDFHEKIGGPNKEARLRYLRKMWTQGAESLNGLEVLGGLDEASWTGMGSFRIKGKNTIQDAVDLQQILENEFGLFTVIRKGLASGACVRITPQVFTKASHIEQLSDALRIINSQI
jgi:selenocysteine lyase/cysteine desulfurase